MKICGAKHMGMTCTLELGHFADQHEAHGRDGRKMLSWRNLRDEEKISAELLSRLKSLMALVELSDMAERPTVAKILADCRETVAKVEGQ